MGLLGRTLDVLSGIAADFPAFRIHYALKANVNPVLLRAIADSGLGADIVSGGELQAALDAGFAPGRIFFAGVGKTDSEIAAALEAGIGCLNVESQAEMEVISSIASALRKTADIAIRVNPDIDAHTHHYITTGLQDNKFGINLDCLDACIDLARSLPGIRLRGLHFHIGSQITILDPFRLLCDRVNSILAQQRTRGVEFSFVNLGGGLGVDHAVGDGDLTLNIAQGGVAGVLNVDKGGHDALVGGRAAPANADDVVGLSVLAQNGQLHLVDGGLDDLIGLQPSLDARLLADGLEELGGPFLVLGTGHALEGESLQGLPCAFFVDRHTCILPSFLVCQGLL